MLFYIKIIYHEYRVKRDFNEIMIYLKMAGKLGDPEGMLNLGKFLFTGTEIEHNKAEAVKWFKLRTVKNDNESMFFLELFCYNFDFFFLNIYASKYIHQAA